MKCANCPTRSDIPCLGEKAIRLCQLIDPAHPDYQPAYREMISRLSEEEAKPPSAAKMAASLARSLWDWAMGGFGMASEKEQARRLEICRACPQWRDGRCLICGCFVNLKFQLKTEHCPLDKW